MDLVWVLHFLPEIESDMSVFHRVEDIYVMRAERFFRLVTLLTAYDGALASRLSRQAEYVSEQPAAAQELTEDQLWAQHRRQAYAGYLAHGEEIREITVAEGVKQLSQPTMGR